MELKNLHKLVINLDSRPDRLLKFEKEFKSFFGDDTYTRIPGVTGKEDKCVLVSRAHKKAVQFAVDHVLDSVCIMEDDVRFSRNRAMGYARSCFNRLPKDWEILLGGAYSETTHPSVERLWTKLVDFSGLHFYVIHKNAYGKILGANETVHIDRYVSRNLSCYRTSKIFATQFNERKSYDYLLNQKELL